MSNTPIPGLTGQFTAAQIITRALEIGNNPNASAQGLDYLNFVLSSLYRNYDWEFAQKGSTIIVPSGSQSGPLPSDFLRVRDVTYQYNGLTFVVEEISLISWDQIAFKTGWSSPIPFEVSVDLLNQVMLVYPIPSTPMTFSMRYYYMPAPITDTTQYPPFPYDYLLVNLVAGWVIALEDDDRMQNWQAFMDLEIKKALRNSESIPMASNAVQLSSQYFRPAGSNRITKIDAGLMGP